MKSPYPRIAAAGCLLAALLTACSTQQRHTWLTVFFEGVPPLPGETPAAPAMPASPPSATGSFTVSAAAAPEAPKWILHAPFQQHKCGVCHAANQSETLRGPQKEICGACHTNVLTGVAVQHWPVKKGKCSACHQPHLSTFDKLLTKSGVALCNDCHDPLNVKPHVHEPVRRGRCLSCHTAHESAYVYLLRKPGDALCARCHEPDEMQKVPGHANTANQTCVACHDPHQSANKDLLK